MVALTTVAGFRQTTGPSTLGNPSGSIGSTVKRHESKRWRRKRSHTVTMPKSENWTE